MPKTLTPAMRAHLDAETTRLAAAGAEEQEGGGHRLQALAW
jgi:hypothetical protein